MTDTRYADAMQRVMTSLGDVFTEVNAEVPFPRWPLRQRILWKLRGVPAEVRAHERQIAQERANLYYRKLRAARDTLGGNDDG